MKIIITIGIAVLLVVIPISIAIIGIYATDEAIATIQRGDE